MIFLGEKLISYEGKVYLVYILEEIVKIVVDLVNDVVVKKNYFEVLVKLVVLILLEDKVVKGLYLGGILVFEVGMLIFEVLDFGGLVKVEGYVLKFYGYEVIDLGDDMYI